MTDLPILFASEKELISAALQLGALDVPALGAAEGHLGNYTFDILYPVRHHSSFNSQALISILASALSFAAVDSLCRSFRSRPRYAAGTPAALVLIRKSLTGRRAKLPATDSR
mgnify:CR=1 FL=1